MMMKLCSVEGCESPAKAFGYCNRHAHAFRNHGDPLGGKQYRPRFSGHITPAGYYVYGSGKTRIREHRVIMEAIIGRPLESHEEVHHINGNTLDNRPENLILAANHSEHMEMHFNRFRSDTHKQCLRCGEIKPRSEFWRNTAGNRDPHLPNCCECMKAYHRQRKQLKKPTPG